MESITNRDLTLEDNLRERLHDLESKVIEFYGNLHEWDKRYDGIYDVIGEYEKYFNLTPKKYNENNRKA